MYTLSTPLYDRHHDQWLTGEPILSAIEARLKGRSVNLFIYGIPSKVSLQIWLFPSGQ